MIRKIIRKLREKRFNYEPLVKIVLDGDRIVKNFRAFQSLRSGTQVAPVLKSNAYGHGLLLVGKKLDKEKPPFFVVDSYHEALMLKNEGIKSDILVLGYTFPKNILNAKRNDIVFGINTWEQLQEIAGTLSNTKRFHLKIDTGMHRQGILIENLDRAIQLILKNPHIVLEGACSHFADADVSGSEITRAQISLWNDVVGKIKNTFPNILYSHIEATAGTRYGNAVQGNVVRVGLGIYGIDNGEKRNINISPVLRMESIVVGIKNLRKGECVGYNATFCADRDMTIATVPVGYFEGVDRRLSQKGFFKIKNIYCPIIGRVNMNMTSVDISGVEGVKEGDSVEIVSDMAGDKNSIESMARVCETIPYDILVGIPERIRRTIQ